MLSSVLRSPRAIAVNIEIMRTFVRLRATLDARGPVTEARDPREEVRLAVPHGVRRDTGAHDAAREAPAPPRSPRRVPRLHEGPAEWPGRSSVLARERGVRYGIGLDDLRVDGALVAPLPSKDLRAGGFDASYKGSANSILLRPLAAVLEAAHGTDAVVTVDPDTSYRVLTEVFFTLAQTGVSRFHFLAVYDTPSGRAVGSIDVYPPARGADGYPVPGPSGPSAPIQVRLRRDGLTVRGSGAKLPIECGDTAQVEGQLPYDLAAIHRCGAALKKSDGRTGDVLLFAAREVPFHLVVATLDALAEAYPHVDFGVMR